MTVDTARFTLPPGRDATAPPEDRGIPRDGVRLLAVTPGGVRDTVFRELPEILSPGDLVVVNISPTLPAALDASHPDGRAAVVHVATRLDDGDWVVELRRTDGTGPDHRSRTGVVVRLPGDVELELTAPYPGTVGDGPSRLWRACVRPDVDLVAHLQSYGRPVSYAYVLRRPDLSAYQNVYAVEPAPGDHGSAEMASAGRPFTAEILVRAIARGIAVAPVVLHAGLSSPEKYEPPMPERFAVPAVTARLVRATRAAGGRVVAVGTTVVRALESATDPTGVTTPRTGWTDLVLGPDRPARVVTGLVSGLHAPEASHLSLLDAVAGPALVDRAYRHAVEGNYLWHEFGDSMLFLP